MFETIKQSKHKQHIPLIFLVVVSTFWAFYYNSNNAWNDYGRASFEWLYMLDGLLVLPVLCWLCIEDKKTAAIKALVYMCLAVLVGGFIIPEENKQLMPYLENGRYVIVAMVLLFEVTAVVTVCWAIQAGFKKDMDPDEAVSEPIEKWLGRGIVAQIMCFEARMWSFLLFNKRIKSEYYSGDRHFNYHNKDGAHSNALGFIWLIVFEIPLMHLLLHFVWSPFAANVVTGLTMFGLGFMVAEYRAMSQRPISILNNQLIIRMGLFNSYRLNLNDVQSVQRYDEYVPRKKAIKRFNLTGNPNVCLHFNRAKDGVRTIYLGVDDPLAFINTIKPFQTVP